LGLSLGWGPSGAVGQRHGRRSVAERRMCCSYCVAIVGPRPQGGDRWRCKQRNGKVACCRKSSGTRGRCCVQERLRFDVSRPFRDLSLRDSRVRLQADGRIGKETSRFHEQRTETLHFTWEFTSPRLLLQWKLPPVNSLSSATNNIIRNKLRGP
jgi:hypothetical protein